MGIGVWGSVAVDSGVLVGSCVGIAVDFLVAVGSAVFVGKVRVAGGAASPQLTNKLTSIIKKKNLVRLLDAQAIQE